MKDKFLKELLINNNVDLIDIELKQETFVLLQDLNDNKRNV